MTGFPRVCFVLSRFQVLLGDGSSKALQKTFYKKIVSKSFYYPVLLQKNREKNPKLMFLDFVYHVFGRFSVRGVKHTKQNIEKNLTLVLFWPLTHPPTTGVTDLFLPAPCRIYPHIQQ
jgi:hypothetical protein